MASMQRVGEDRQLLLVYTDDPVLAVGVCSVLSSVEQFRVMAAEPELFRLVPTAEQTRPAIVLIDLTAEVTVSLLSAVRRAAPQARLILWGRYFSEELCHQAREIGVAGFLHRGLPTEEFSASLTEIIGGESLMGSARPADSKTVPLTKRESQLVTLLAQGLRNKEIAACLGITEGTVRIYLSKLFAKLGARDRLEVAVFGLQNSHCGQAPWDGRDGFITEADADRARPVLRSLVLVEPKRRRGYAPQLNAVNG